MKAILTSIILFVCMFAATAQVNNSNLNSSIIIECVNTENLNSTAYEYVLNEKANLTEAFAIIENYDHNYTIEIRKGQDERFTFQCFVTAILMIENLESESNMINLHNIYAKAEKLTAKYYNN